MKKAFEGIGKGLTFLTNNRFFWYFVLAVLAWFGYKKLTTSPETAFLDSEIPNSGKDVTIYYNPSELVERFHNYFSSWFDVIINTSELEICYTLANALSDGEFVIMVKTYNAKYAKSDGVGIITDTIETLWKRSKSSKKILFGTGTMQQSKFYDRMTRLKQNY
jgi:hypothetical protein